MQIKPITMMTLKERLEEVWRTGGCQCPNHLVRWNEKGVGYIKFCELGIWYQQGNPTRTKDHSSQSITGAIK